MKVLRFFRKVDIFMHRWGKLYGIVFKLIIPFFVMLIPFDQMLGLVFGSEYIVVTIPIIDVVKILENNPFYLGTFALDIIGGAFLVFAIILVFFPRLASVIEFIMLPSYILFLYVILNWKFNLLGLASLVVAIAFLVCKLLTFGVSVLRKVYKIKPLYGSNSKRYGYY